MNNRDSYFFAYFAGFFDGEGSIGIYRNGSTTGRTLRVQVTQVVSDDSTALLNACRERWGGSLCEFNKEFRSPAWNWQVSASSAALALTDLRPWLRLKAAQADIALNWWKARPPRRRDAQGRHLPMSLEHRKIAEEAEQMLKAVKRERRII